MEVNNTMSNSCVLKVKKLSDKALPLKREYEDAVGIDIAVTRLIKVENGISYWGTDWAIELPQGYEAQLRPRSSMPKQGWTLANSVGTIDTDYRGEIIVALQPTVSRAILRSLYEFTVNPEIAHNDIVSLLANDYLSSLPIYLTQLVVKRKEQVSIQEVTVLTETERGNGGFGSSDKKSQ